MRKQGQELTQQRLPLAGSWPRMDAAAARAALVAAMLVLAAVHVLVLAYHLGLTLAFPYDLNYGEGYVLNDAVRLARGEAIYVNLQEFPMVRSPYPPLFPWLWSTVVGLAGPVLWPGRAISILSSIGLLALCGWSARRVQRGSWAIVAAPALVAASPFIYDWAGYARVDMLALLLAAAGVCVAQWLRGWRGVVLAAVCCTLAIWTKQTTLTAALAVALALLLGSRVRGLAFVALVAAPSALLAAWLNATTGGEFWRHVVEGNASNPMVPLRSAYYLGALLALHLPLVVAVGWWLSRALHGGASPIAVYVPIALLAAVSAGNSGSSVNYLIEPIVALSLALPFAWRAAESTSVVAAPLLAAVQLLVLLHVPNGFGTGYLAESALGRTPTASDASIGAQVDELVRSEPGDVLVEAAGFTVRNGKQVLVQPIDLRAEELRGRWQAAPLVEALAAGRFKLVITTWDFLPAEAEHAVAEHFRLESTLDSPDGLHFRVYRYAG